MLELGVIGRRQRRSVQRVECAGDGRSNTTGTEEFMTPDASSGVRFRRSGEGRCTL